MTCFWEFGWDLKMSEKKFCCLTYNKSLTFLAISNLYINDFHSQTQTNIYHTQKKKSHLGASKDRA